jgi:gliding motility-associated-like protein
MKKLFLFFVILSSLKSTSQCVQINSIFVNSCTVGTGTGFCDSEGYNEMFTFTVGSSDLNVSDIAVVWPNNTFQGWCSNALTALKTDSLNNTIISSCGFLLEPPGGVIPAGAEVIVLTSENFCVAANSFEGLADTMYIIYQCNGVSTGYFANTLTSGQTRTLTVNVSGSCTGSASATYDSAIPVVDGATALFDEFGNVSYVVNGCNAPVITQNPFWSFSTNVCHNFGDIDLNTLLSFNATQGGVWSGAGVSGSIFNPSGLFGETSITYTISGAGVCTDLSDSTIIFSVDTIVIESQLAQSCDSVFVNGVWYYDDTFISYTVASVTPFACETRFEVTIDVTDVDIDSTYIFACDSAFVNGIWFYADTIIRDTIPGSGGGSVQTDTILFTGFENSDGWSNQTTVANGTWTMSTPDGDWIGYDMYANGGDTYNGSRKIGFNTLGDWFQLPPVDNPVSMTYFMRLSTAPTGTHEMTIQYFDGTNWVDIQANIIVSTTYVQITVDLSAISSLTGVLLRMFISERGNRSFFVDDILVEGILPPEPATCDQINIFTIEIAPRPDFDTINFCTNDPALQGMISDTLSSLAGCDSLITTTITTFLPTTTNTINLCTNDPLLAGMVTDTVFSVLGCDSIYNETITTLINLITIIDDLCTHDPLLVGTQRDTVLSVLGCDSIYNERITTLATPVTNTFNQCTNNPALVGTTIDTVFSALGCDSIYNETITTLIVPVTIIDNFCTNDPLQAGTLRDTILSVLGCDSIYNERITTFVNSVANTTFLCTNNPAEVGTVTDTLLSVLGCDSVYNQAATTLVNTTSEITFECTNNAANAGVFNDTVFSTLGCDSLYREVNVEFITVLTQTVAQLCTNNASQAGVFTDTIFSLLGCDSIYNQTITTLIVPVTIIDNFCTNDPLQAGTLRDTVLSVLGCDSIYNDRITTFVNSVANTTFLCTNNPAEVGTVTDTLLSVLGCDSVYNQAATTLVNTTSEITFECTNNAANAGVFNDTVFSTLGCDSLYREVNVEFITVLTQTVAQLCTNNASQAGVFTDTIFSVLGCDSIYNETITTLIVPVTIIDNFCTNDPLQAGTLRDTILSVLGCDSIYNERITTFVNSVTNTTFLCTNNPAEVGTVTDTLLSVLSCDSVYNQAVTTLVNTTSEITFECTNNAANAGGFTDTILSTLGCDSIYLERNVAFVSVTTQTIAQLCTNNAAQAGVFNDTILSSLGCDSIINQTFVELISPVTIASDVACTNIPSEAATVYTDTLYSFQGCDSIYFAENTVWVELSSTQFSLEACDSLKIGGITYYESYQRNDTLFSALGCDSIVEIFTVTINQSPVVDAGEDISINQGENAILSATVSGATEFLWEWATGDTQQNPFTVNPLETTIYTITVSNENCSAQDAVTVFVQKINMELFIPDAFTPNGDGINDVFEVANKEFFTDITMNIFNRWGELIHKEVGANHGWDGTYKGELQNPEVFVYFITAKNLSGTQSYTAKGSVTLIR